MGEREIVVFRYRKSLRIGSLREVSGDKVRVAAGKHRDFLIPRSNVLLETGVLAPTLGELDVFRRGVEDLAKDLDLAEVWEVAGEDSGALGFRELTELYFSQTPDSARYAAMLWHLNSGACPYFQLDEERYVPAPAEAVEEQRKRMERQEREAKEDQEFLAWLRGESDAPCPEEMSPRQKAWLERVRSLVVEGDDWSQASRVKTFLSRIPEMGKDVRRTAFRLLVARGIFDIDENLQLCRLAVEIDFETQAEREAAAFDASRAETGEPGRRDLTDLEVFSIDDETTADVDDAFSITPTETGYRLGIHITDLSLAVRPGSALDEVARSRVCSLYFPERKIPMLPPVLSEGSGSLLPGRERLALSLLADIDRSLEVEAVRIAPANIVNRHRLCYDEVNDILEGEHHPLGDRLKLALRFAVACRERRVAAGAALIERPELEIRVDDARRIDIKVRPDETPAQLLVSEMMIFYNVEAARFCRDHALPVIYRTQEGASYDLSEPAPHPALRRHRFLKSIPPPDLTLEPRPHRLLGVELYCQLSSPLRRYIDLLLQRQLSSFLANGKARHASDEVSMILFQAEERLRELRPLEAERSRYWLFKHLEPRVGEAFEAVILEANGRIGLAELLDFPVRVSVALHSAVTPGDVLPLRLARVDPWDGTIRFAQQ